MTAEYQVGKERYIIQDGCYSFEDLEKIIGMKSTIDLLVTRPGITMIRQSGACFLDVDFLNLKNRSVVFIIDRVEHRISHFMPEARVRKLLSAQ